ncbi:MAG TPA: AMP-binding protein [Pseudonocardiaceae bacterium]|jgi:fatty-acyl-CoA synthase|nr:AMP-binding protein [Pseudonocardiaceae bacterium]
MGAEAAERRYGSLFSCSPRLSVGRCVNLKSNISPVVNPILMGVCMGPFDGHGVDGMGVLSHHVDRIAFQDEDGRLTYAQARDTVYRIAGALRQVGVSADDMVAFTAPFSTFTCLFQYAVNVLGAGHLELPGYLPVWQRAQIAAEAGARLMVVDPAVVDDEELRYFREVADVEVIATGPSPAVANLADLAKRESAQPFTVDIDPRSPMSVDLTGGSTARPKLAVRRFNAHPDGMAELFFSTDHPVKMLKTSRMSNVGSVMVRSTLAGGGTVYSRHGFDALAVLGSVETDGLTHLFLPPPYLRALLDVTIPGFYDLSSLRCVVTSTAPASVALMRRAIDAFGPIVHHVYGQTESGMVTVLGPADYVADAPAGRLATCGRAHPSTAVDIRDHDGRSLEKGRRGVIWCRTPWPYDGYWDGLRQEAERGNWQSTGDIGCLDEDGYLTVLGREFDAVDRDGTLVLPREVEECVAEHPDVREAVAFGVTTGGRSDLFVAAVLSPGRQTSAEALRSWVACRLGPGCTPDVVEFIATIPMTYANKPDRVLLRSRFGSAGTSSLPGG